MASSNNTINARIKLKSDTEANWQLLAASNESEGFIPLNGEIIIYSPDNTHSYSRLKVGDGIQNVNDLPFIDSGTVDGEDEFISKYASTNNFPQPGSSHKLYIDLSTKSIYHYDGATGYTPLLNFTIDVDTVEVANIVSWDQGRMTRATVNNNTLNIVNGNVPNLLYYNTIAVSEVTKGENE